MSGRGHRGKRPRGDGTRGPRTSSCTGRPHVGPASLLCDAAFCDLQRHGFAILIIAAVWSILGYSAKAAAWSLLCWLSSLASRAAAFVLVMSFSPCISFIIPRLVRLVQIKILTLVVAVELFVQRCMGAPVPTPTPTPDPPPGADADADARSTTLAHAHAHTHAQPHASSRAARLGLQLNWGANVRDHWSSRRSRHRRHFCRSCALARPMPRQCALYQRVLRVILPVTSPPLPSLLASPAATAITLAHSNFYKKNAIFRVERRHRKGRAARASFAKALAHTRSAQLNLE